MKGSRKGGGRSLIALPHNKRTPRALRASRCRARPRQNSLRVKSGSVDSGRTPRVYGRLLAATMLIERHGAPAVGPSSGGRRSNDRLTNSATPCEDLDASSAVPAYWNQLRCGTLRAVRRMKDMAAARSSARYDGPHRMA